MIASAADAWAYYFANSAFFIGCVFAIAWVVVTYIKHGRSE